MTDKNEVKKMMLNAKGKRLLNMTKLEYSMFIINELQKKPELLEEILLDMEMTKEEFIEYISGERNGNISFYDSALEIVKMKKNARQK